MKKYENVYTELVEQILSNKIVLGDTIPSEYDLCKKFNVSRTTIRYALNELNKNGYIYKSQGKESVVINNIEKRKIVLLIVQNIFTYIFPDIIKNIENILRKNNISLFIAPSYNDRTIEQNIINNHINDIDGIILEPSQYSLRVDDENTKGIYSKLSKIPCVLMNSPLQNINLPKLITDDEDGTFRLTNALVQKECKNFLTVFKTDDYQGTVRLKGIEKALNDYDNIFHKSLEFYTFNVDEFLTITFNETRKYNYDAIMFHNDELAYRFIEKYPEFNSSKSKIFITGFDSHDYSNGKPFYFPSLNHPKGQIGIDAANIIIDLINGKEVNSITYSVDITNL